MSLLPYTRRPIRSVTTDTHKSSEDYSTCKKKRRRRRREREREKRKEDTREEEEQVSISVRDITTLEKVFSLLLLILVP